MALVDLQKALNLFHKGIQELVGITLNHRIDWYSFISYEGFAEFLDGETPLVAVLERFEYILQLINLIFLQCGLVLLTLN
jgi:hypothetical protein